MFYHSEALAGRMGMTRQLLTALQSAAQAWVQARVPMFGELIARRDFRSLDEKFRRLFVVSTLVLLAGGLGFLLFLVVLEQYFPLLASRVLSPVPTAIMLLAMLLFQLPFCQTLYLRAHKVEPVMWVTLASNLGIGLSVWLLGIYWADLGAAFGHMLIVLFITVPGIHIIWLRCRRKWHTLSEGSSS
jgi:Na+-driven multidrug efflux pump